MTWSTAIGIEIAAEFDALVGVYEGGPGMHILRGARVRPVACGEACARSKLTAADVLAIRAALDTGATQSSQATRFSVSVPTVSYIARRITWAHLPEAA